MPDNYLQTFSCILARGGALSSCHSRALFNSLNIFLDMIVCR